MIPHGSRDGGSAALTEFSEDAAVARGMYRALEEGDAGALARWVDPKVRWVHPMVTRLPFDGTRHGLPDVLRAAFRRDEDGIGPRVSADTFLEFGDGILVVGRLLHERGAGEAVVELLLHEYSVRDGRVVLIRKYPA